MTTPTFINIFIIAMTFTTGSFSFQDNSYLSQIKEKCFSRGEALSCLKYKAIKDVTKSFLGDEKYSNVTSRSYSFISLVPFEPDYLDNITFAKEEILSEQRRGYFSEWSELTVYWFEVLKDFFTHKGVRIELPDGSRSLETELENQKDESRGKKKRLAIILPLLSLLATLKTKVLLIPILLAVLFIKKLLLAAALLIPSFLSTLKACKLHHHHGFHLGAGNSESSSEFSSAGYGGGYSYSSGYPNKDWAASRAYNMQKPRPSPMYVTSADIV